jgi:3-oxocholest-4-en-26-oate---CoA ligase
VSRSPLPPRPIHLADILEAIADAVPDRIAVATADRDFTYADVDDRSTRLANYLLSLGIADGDHVAVHSANRIEWVDAFYGCFKARAVPININYKYLHDELAYVYANADCVAAIVAPEHLDAVRALELPQLRNTLVLGDDYDAMLGAASADRIEGRTADDRYVLYTGGTTGAPKGVVWRQEDIVRAAMNASRFGAPIESVEQLAEEAAARDNPMTLLACGPLMHGGSQWILGNGHVAGFTVALYTEASFDARKILDLVERARVSSLSILGDAMGGPVADAILAEPGRWDLGSLISVSNGAAPLSEGVRIRIRQALPGRFILDTYGASESGATASRIDDGSEVPPGNPRFGAAGDVEVFDERMRPCPPGVEGILGRSGPIPLGYYKDPARSAATFREVGGIRWSFPGDAARREADGSVTVLGRGSVCINTGGEKVHPEEVEAALLRHAGVLDAAVVGTPHEHWGQQVTALVELRDGAGADEDGLRQFVHELIANYKVPKRILFVARVPRTPVSKVDYPASAALARRLLG